MYTRDQLKKWGNQSAPVRIKLLTPIIQFNGSKGSFSLLKRINDVIQPAIALPSSLEVTILRARRSLGWYERNLQGQGIFYSTNEHNDYNDSVSLFKHEKGKKSQLVDSGLSRDLRNRHPQIKVNRELYVLLDDTVHKIKVKGKSMQNFMIYHEELSKDGKLLFDFSTKLGIKEETGAGFQYYSITFEAGTPTDLEKVGPFIEHVGTTLEKIDKQAAIRAISIQDEQRQLDETQPELPSNEPVINVDDDIQEEEIKVEDIPF